jgi:hypothetical protein
MHAKHIKPASSITNITTTITNHNTIIYIFISNLKATVSSNTNTPRSRVVTFPDGLTTD